MTENYIFEDIKFLVFMTVLSIFIFKFGVILITKIKSDFFGLCISNHKTSLYHEPMLRGLGLMFPIACFPFILQLLSDFKIHEIILILLSTILGFYDDKKNLEQKRKFLVILLLSVFYVVVEFALVTDTSIDFFKFIIKVFCLIFLLLFFNQIDGINGLAALTYIILLVIIGIIKNNFILVLPFLVVSIHYLCINLRGKLGIQGEAGSFFMGSSIFVIVLNLETNLNQFIIVFLASPILMDIVCTTLVRYFSGKNILKGHNSNLYQRLVYKFKSHFWVALMFGFLQVITTYFVFCSRELFNEKQFFLIVFLILTILFFIFIFFANLIHKKKILF